METHATGQVISKEANFVTVRVNKADVTSTAIPERTDLLCSVRALLKKIKQTVLVGDNVQVASIDWIDKRGVVQEVFNRHSEMSDPAMANVDQIILVMSLNLPPFDARQATRFLVSAEAADIPVMLLLNKADLLHDDMTQALIAEVQHWGYKAIAVSVASGQEYPETSQTPARQQIASSIAPHTSDATAFSHDTWAQTADVDSSSRLRPSQEDGEQQQLGNGLIMPGQQQQSNKPNAGLDSSASSSRTLQNNEASSSSFAFEMPSQSAGQHLEKEGEQVGMGAQSGVAEGVRLQSVGEMSNIGRGMHTTRHVALLEVGRGLLADTPGFNVPSLTNLTISNLQACFPEIERRLDTYRCAFSNCQHLQEPGCCLHEDFDRHPIYVELYHEVKQNEDLERHRSMSKKRRQGTVRFKTKAGGEQSREALLETKTHRRVNRRQTRQGMQDLIDKASQEEGVDL
ncbi:hypothetical protein WJX79_003335 [Trebouxia sp. C0005]